MSSQVIAIETEQDAIEAYFEHCEVNGLIASQPDQSATEAIDEGWLLCNVNGPLAIVTNDGKVLMSVIGNPQVCFAC